MIIKPDKDLDWGIYLSRLKVCGGVRLYPSELLKLAEWLKVNARKYEGVKDA